MTTENKIEFPHGRPLVLSTWLVAVAAMLLYGLTLNHWVSLRSLELMAQVTGWNWHPYPLEWRPQAMAPLFLAVTAPVRLLPVAWQPLALNIFTAVCAALTLGLLARSVRLMAHDRTLEQRMREQGPDALLSFRLAFVPQLFAVLMLATQLAFWQNAIVATGEMLNLLVFALIIDCLMEYRVSKSEKWLHGTAFLFGLGASNNWALLGFFPLYLLALLRLKGFFGLINVRFLMSMFWRGLVGLALYLLVPCLGSAQGEGEGFFSLLHLELGSQSYGLRLVPRWVGLVAAVPTILPVLLASIKWPDTEGEVSAAGDQLTRFLYRMLHVAFLVLTLVTFFDLKFSPSVRMREQPVSFLTFYYMGALSVGYFSGYILLVFGPSRLGKIWDRRNAFQKNFGRVLHGFVCVVAIVAPVLLACQSYPHVRAGNTSALQQFADQTVDSLPAKKSIVLSDDAIRLYLLQADFERRGLRNDHFLIETESFPHREYIAYLGSHYPGLHGVMTTNTAALPSVLSSRNLMDFMFLVTRNFPVYYLHPSFGYYFEALYLRPSGLVYELKPYTTNLTQPPVATEAEIKANQAYWAKLENGPLNPLPALAKLNPEPQAIGIDYSVALDYWGTELQKANHLKEAQAQFAEAVRLNPDNFIASLNLQYNEHLQKGQRTPIDSGDAFVKALYSYRGLVPLLRRNGPVDEPGVGLDVGKVLAKGGNLRQAATLFQRRLQLLPEDAETELDLAKTDVDLGRPDKALDLLRKLRGSTKIGAWELFRCEALAYMAKGDYETAERVLLDAVKADPNDENRVGTLAEYYRIRGIELMNERKKTEATRFFTYALTNSDRALQLLASGKDTDPAFDVSEMLLKKAEIQTKLHSYADAASTLSQVLERQPKNFTALMNRAVTEIQLKRFPAAKDDFNELGKLLPEQPYLAEFGLAEVASAQTNQVDELEHLKQGVKSAPKNSSDYQQALKRIKALEHK